MTAAVIPLPPFRRGDPVLVDGETPAVFVGLAASPPESEPIAKLLHSPGQIAAGWQSGCWFVRLSRVRRVMP